MKIKGIKNLDKGVSNIEISGEVTYALEPKNWIGTSKGRNYNFFSQFVAVEDDSDSIGCNVTFRKEEQRLEEGNVVTLKGKVDEYTDNDGNLVKSFNGHRIIRDKEKKAAVGEKKNNNNKENKNLMIAREVALKVSARLIEAEAIEPKDLLTSAEKLVRYIFEGLPKEKTAVEAKATEGKTLPDKEEEYSSARHIPVGREPLEVRSKDAPFPDEEEGVISNEDIPGDSYDNPIPWKKK